MKDSNLSANLTLKECFAFPVQTAEARRDVFIGGFLLFTLLFGWICNLGHRLDVVYRIYHRHPPYFRGFLPLGKTFLRGLKAFSAIFVYLSPGAIFGLSAYFSYGRVSPALLVSLSIMAIFCFLVGIFSLPGGMTYNAAFNDISYLYRPDKAFRRAFQAGSLYLKAWGIGLLAIVLSFAGVLGLGIGFFFSSVWAWMVVGYAFSKALSLKNEETHA